MAAWPHLRKMVAKGWPLWAFLLLLAGAGAAPVFMPSSSGFANGDFRLTDQHGRIREAADFLGTPSLLFFGYTYCPDICPTTLARLSAALDILGRTGVRPKVFFVSVDPARDSAAQMGAYLAAFDSRITGLTGSPDQVAAAARAFRVQYRMVGDERDGGYRIDHAATIFVAGADGRLAGMLRPDLEPEAMAAEIERLLATPFQDHGPIRET